MVDTTQNLPAASAEVANRLERADKLEGMPHAGTETPDGPPHAEPKALGLDATMWVAAAMAILIAVAIFKGVPRLIAALLDKQIAAIRSRLDEAKALRAEAEALRDEYARKIAGVEAQAAEMVAHADEEAKALIARAKADADELVRRRAKMAEDKIAAAERAALDEVRARTADAAAKAAAAIIAQKHDAGADKALVDRTIAGLSRLN
jgi:F-type H+-transporting ATPase subunit b